MHTECNGIFRKKIKSVTQWAGSSMVKTTRKEKNGKNRRYGKEILTGNFLQANWDSAFPHE